MPETVKITVMVAKIKIRFCKFRAAGCLGQFPARGTQRRTLDPCCSNHACRRERQLAQMREWRKKNPHYSKNYMKSYNAL